jgi:hypothetical protein
VIRPVPDFPEPHSRLGEPTSHSSCDLPETQGAGPGHMLLFDEPEKAAPILERLLAR